MDNAENLDEGTKVPLEEQRELAGLIKEYKVLAEKAKETDLAIPTNELGSYEIETQYDLIFNIYQDLFKIFDRVNQLENFKKTRSYSVAQESFGAAFRKLSDKLEEMANEGVRRVLDGEPLP